MARPLRIEYPHAHYHVTCRGNDRRRIFRDDDDRYALLERLRRSLEIYEVKLHCYVLMDNHFHLVAQTPKANLSEFMRHFNVAYTSFFNRRHGRTGHLYQGRFKAILIQPDAWLLELSRYVHMNPVRTPRLRRGIVPDQVGQLWRYRWSSLGGYVSARRRKSWVHYDEVLSPVGHSRRRYGRFVQDGLEQGVPSPWKQLRGQVILGDDRFWAGARERWAGASGSPAAQKLPSPTRMEPARITAEVASYFSLAPERLRRKRGRCRDQRGLLMELLYRHGGMTQQAIGAHLGGLDYTAVSHERRRFRERVAENEVMANWWREIDSALEAGGRQHSDP